MLSNCLPFLLPVRLSAHLYYLPFCQPFFALIKLTASFFPICLCISCSFVCLYLCSLMPSNCLKFWVRERPREVCLSYINYPRCPCQKYPPPLSSYLIEIVSRRPKQVSSSVADTELGSGIQCLFDPWIRDPGWVKNQDSDPG